MTQPFPRTKQLSTNGYEQPSKRTAELKRNTTHQCSALPTVWANTPGCLPLLHVAFTPLLSLKTSHSLSSITCRRCFRDTPQCSLPVSAWGQGAPPVPQLLEGLPPFWHISPLLPMTPSKSLLQTGTGAEAKTTQNLAPGQEACLTGSG